MSHTGICIILLMLMLPMAAIEAGKLEPMKVDDKQVKSWNLFTERLYELHSQQLRNRNIDKKVTYGGYKNLENFYRQEAYIDMDSGKLISRIQWETKNPGLIHMIEVFVYNRDGKLELDYLSAYLPQSRNAPIQTLINVHHHDKYLSSYRQFDASGDRIYEQCKGEFFGEPLFMSLDEDDIPFGAPAFEKQLHNDAYASCFGDLMIEVGELLNPLDAANPAVKNGDGIDSAMLIRPRNINPQDVLTLTRLGIYHFQQLEFEQAIEYLNQALRIDAQHDEALFWRGMAYGRNKQHQLGIADLSQYIDKHPHESRAYTKRGVRYIWSGDLKSAKRDLLEAIRLDETNSEAHDDLGVLYAQERNYHQAIDHFRRALKHDSTYQKAWHNMSMVHYVMNQNVAALQYVDKSLVLKSNKDSLLLKSLILDTMGQHEQAEKLRASAEAATGNNWSETFRIK